METWIELCLTPIYKFHWTEGLMDQADKNSILIYVALNDRRLWIK